MDLTKGEIIIEKSSNNIDTNFVETQLILKTESGNIYGTITTPKVYSNIAVALTIAGSGPTDRDFNNVVIKCDAYKKLAYGLAENNIATLHYDKRGIAASAQAGKSEESLRFDDYVNDAQAWIALLKNDISFF